MLFRKFKYVLNMLLLNFISFIKVDGVPVQKNGQCEDELVQSSESDGIRINNFRRTGRNCTNNKFQKAGLFYKLEHAFIL